MYLKLGCRALVAALAGALVVIAPATAAHAAVACEVSYSVSQWPPGFSGAAQIRNTGDEPWNGYTVEFRFPGSQAVTSLWNHTWTQTGQSVTARSAPWLPPVPPGAAFYLGFTANNPSGPNNPPIDWRVNGIPCATPGAPAVVATPDVVTIPEGGGGTFSVRLSHPPAQSVSLGMRITGTGTWASPPVILVFTPANWSTPQIYPVMSPDDPDTVDDRAVFTLSATGYASDTVVVQQVDND
jgi:cellulose 1,4-beta-cellobiosidase